MVLAIWVDKEDCEVEVCLICYIQRVFMVVWLFAKASFCVRYVIAFSKKDIFVVKTIFAANLTNVGDFMRVPSTFLFDVFNFLLMCLTIE